MITNMIDMNKIWIVDLEAVESRYTGQWKTHITQILGIESLLHNKYEIILIIYMKSIINN